MRCRGAKRYIFIHLHSSLLMIYMFVFSVCDWPYLLNCCLSVFVLGWCDVVRFLAISSNASAGHNLVLTKAKHEQSHHWLIMLKACKHTFIQCLNTMLTVYFVWLCCVMFLASSLKTKVNFIIWFTGRTKDRKSSIYANKTMATKPALNRDSIFVNGAMQYLDNCTIVFVRLWKVVIGILRVVIVHLSR